MEAKKYIQATQLYKKYLGLVKDDPDAESLADAKALVQTGGDPKFQRAAATP